MSVFTYKLHDTVCVCNTLFVPVLHAQEMRKFLALPIHEKKTQTARTMAKLTKELVEQVEEDEEEQEQEEEGKEKMKNRKQIKSRTVLPKETPRRHELKMAMMKRGRWRKSQSMPKRKEANVLHAMAESKC